MKQIKVSLPDGLRAQLEEAATNADHSLSEEVRTRIEESLEEDVIDPETRKLMAGIGALAHLVRIQTGRNWYDHAASNRVLRHAITARLERMKGGTDEAVFHPGELPVVRLVAAGSDDPREMGLALEAVDFHTHPPDNWRPFWTAGHKREEGDKS
jgi:hypothetical protein